MDGRPLLERLDGTAIALDPGEHKFTFQAAGHKGAERAFVLREHEKSRRETIVLDIDTTPPPATLSPAAPASATPPSIVDETPPPAPSHAVSPLVFVAGGAAVVGIGIGIGAGVAAGSKHSALTGECNGNDCPPSAQGDIDSFHTLKTVSTVGYLVGFLGLATGAALYLLLPTKPSAGVGMFVGPSAVGFAGKF